GYQVSYADAIRKHCQIPTIAVGLVTRLEQVEEILGNDRSDLVALGRELLRNPYWVINQDGRTRQSELHYPKPYERGRG
ncbi:MAG: NADPH dehydrogenase, partial [Clostridia bacterium]|nr:NADPH dehydrogenase [Clostridia bacterium]